MHNENPLVISNEILKDLEDLQERSELLATEDFKSFITDVKSYFTNKINTAFSVFNTLFFKSKDMVLQKGKQNVHVKELISIKPIVNKIINSKEFSEVEIIKTATIPGINVNLLELTNTYLRSVVLINGNLKNDIELLNRKINLILTDRDYRTSVSPIRDIITDTNVKLKRDLEYTFNTKNFKDTDKVGNLIPNLSSINIIIDNIIEACNGYTKEYLEAIMSETEKLTYKTNTLFEYLRDNPNTEISKNVLKDISYSIKAVAEEITYSISIIHTINLSANITKVMIEEINKK